MVSTPSAPQGLFERIEKEPEETCLYRRLHLVYTYGLGIYRVPVNNSYTQKSVGLDSGFGSSNFGVCISELVDGMVNVLHAEKYTRPDFNEKIKTTVKLIEQYDIRFNNVYRIFVDGANPSFISTLKQAVSEDPQYEKQIQYYLKHYPSS